MTTETSNARGEWVLVPRELLDEARNIAMEWTLKGRVPECGKFGHIAQDLDAMLAAAQPPAAARGDVRGLVALAEQMERDAAGCRRDGYTDAAVVKEDCAQRIRQTLGISAIAEALAAEGVQAGEVEQRARDALKREPGQQEGESASGYALRIATAALSQQPEARGGGEVVAFDIERARTLIEYVVGYARSAELKPLSSDACVALRDLHELLHTAPPSAPVGVKTLSEFMAEQEALHPGIHDKVQAATDELRASLAQQPAAVDEGFVSRLAEALTDQDWDVDPDGDGSGIAQLRAAVVAAQHQEPKS